MSQVKKILFGLLCLTFLSRPALSDLIIQEWRQTNILNKNNQKVTINIRLKATNLPKNTYYNGWSYIFDPNQPITITEARVIKPSVNGRTNVSNKTIYFNFEKLFNNQDVELQFAYIMPDANTTPYTTTKYVGIPNLAAGANAFILAKVYTNDMNTYLTNNVLLKQNNQYFWSGKVPKEGITDYVNLTPKRAKWLISTNVDLTDSERIGSLTVTMPQYYALGINDIIEYKAFNNQTDYTNTKVFKIKQDSVQVKFNKLNQNTAFIKTETIIDNYNYNYSNKYKTALDINNYLKIDNFTANALQMKIAPLLEKYRNTNEQMYLTLAKLVHSEITYDKAMYGKIIKSPQILEQKNGVCDHFSLLYQDLLRTYNIPATAVSGLAYDSKNNKFERHSWVLVYVNGEWLPIDPTWGLYSGVVPISHILLSIGLNIEYKFQRIHSLNKLTADIKEEAKMLE